MATPDSLAARSSPRFAPLLLVALGLVLAIASCATSAGATYASSASGEAAAARASAAAAEKKEADKEREGPRPPSWEPQEGPWAAPRWEPAERTAPSIATVPAYRPAETGTLELGGLESGAEVRVDGILRSEGARMALSAGDHSLRVERFGYRAFESPVSILAGAATRIDLVWRPSRFYLTEIGCSPAAFDPRDPGYLGSAAISVRASAPGRASAAIVSPDGATLREIGPFELERALTVARWDGRDERGRVAANGEYGIRVRAIGSDGLEDEMSARVRIVEGAYARSSSLYSGVSGSALAPDARILAPGGFELASTALFHVQGGEPAAGGLGTVAAGARFGLRSPFAAEGAGYLGADYAGGLELDLSCMGVLWTAEPLADSFAATAAAKVGLAGAAGEAFAAAAYAKLSYARFLSSPSGGYAPSWDGHTRYSGISAGLPLEIAVGSARAFVSPELQVSGFYPYWADVGAERAVPGLFAWGYLRTGVEGSLGPLSLALSAAFRSRPFGSSFGLRLPLPVAAELRWHDADSPLVLELFAAGEIRAPGSYYFGGGIGVGARY